MKENAQVIVEMFERYFHCDKRKRIVIYGEIPYINLIIRSCKDYNFIGILQEHYSDMVVDLPVISFNDIHDYQIDMIIVIDWELALTKFNRRLYSFCSTHFIQLYTFSGENLLLASLANRDLLLYNFEKNFESYRKKRIILYGTGLKTQKILDTFIEYNILGVMDKNLKQGWCNGKKIISYDEVLELNVDIIIIAASLENTRFIYKRIKDFCNYNHILLYDVSGNNLFETLNGLEIGKEYDFYYDLNEEELKRQIKDHEVISFDLFDTLIMRKTLIPEDVFEIVEGKLNQIGVKLNNFHELRKIAQRQVNIANPNIYEIYDELKKITNLTSNQINNILELELETEKAVLIVRKKMVEIFEYALKSQKKVFIISDMYLPSDFLNSVLKQLGISCYDKLIVSCDYRISKWEGLFVAFKDEVKANSYLHIGDHSVADGYCPEQAGINFFLIKKASDMLEISSYASVRGYLRNANERSLVGLFVSRAFNNPFILYHTEGKIKVSEISDLGYLFISPLVTCFMIWFIYEVARGKYDNILFASRDGYLIHQLYEYILENKKIKLPKGIYFQISREVALNISVESIDDIIWLCSLPYEKDIETVLRRKFHISGNELLKYDKSYYNNPIQYGLENKEIILKKSKEIRENYIKYINSLKLSSNGKLAFFDLVSSGTCQESLNKILPIEIGGLYLCNYDNPSGKGEGLNIKSMILEHRNVQDNTYISYEKNSYIYSNYVGNDGKQYKNYVFLETLLTSLAPSLCDVLAFGELVYADEKRSMEELEYVKEMHRCIKEYFESFINDLYLMKYNISPKLGDLLFSFKDLEYTNECCEILDKFELIDDMGLGKFSVMRH